MEWMEFCEKISCLLHLLRRFINFEYDEEKISYVISSEKIVYTKSEYDELVKRANNYEFKPFSIYNDNTYEVALNAPDAETRMFFMLRIEEKLLDFTSNDEDLNISYSFKEISDEFIWYIIKHYDINRVVSPRFDNMKSKFRLGELSDKGLFNVLKIAIKIPFVLMIRSDNVMSKERF